MIEVSNVTKTYGTQKALDAVAFSVPTGEILGFLGPNGAGKTTMMKIITCFMPPTAGTVEVDGMDVEEHSFEIRRRIGYLPETTPLYPDMNVLDYLRFIQELRKIDKAARGARLKKMVELCGLGEVTHKDIGELSKGYRQRVGLAQALIHDPEILILDEPTVGLDPNQIVEIRTLITELGREKTLVYCTHILSEVEAACSRVLIINRGEIVADGTPETLKAQAAGHVQTTVEIGGTGGDAEATLAKLPGVVRVAALDGTPGAGMEGRMAGPRFLIESERGDSGDLRVELFRLCVERDWTLLELHSEQVRLEDVFRQLTRGAAS